jgi:hypothetical protein
VLNEKSIPIEGLENPHMEGFLKVIGVSKMDDLFHGKSE